MQNLIKRPVSSILTNYLIIFAIFIVSNNCLSAMETVSADNEKKTAFQLHILKGDSFKLLGNITYEQSLQILKKVDLSTSSDFIITEQDIENYNWQQQSIVLTVDKSMDLIRKYLAKNVSLNDFTSGKYNWTDVEYGLYTLAFLITLNDEVIYGGIFIRKASSTGASHPVIYVEPGYKMSCNPFKLQIKLEIRPFSSLESYQNLPTEIRQQIEHEKIYNFFSKIGKLVN